MQTTGMGAADPKDGVPRPLVIANPAARRGRTGRELADLLAPLREALGELDVAVTENRGAVEVLVRSRDDVNAAVVLSRAEALLVQPVAVPPAGPPRATH